MKIYSFLKADTLENLAALIAELEHGKHILISTNAAFDGKDFFVLIATKKEETKP